jgi:uncharacterized protein with GYD domain
LAVCAVCNIRRYAPITVGSAFRLCRAEWMFGASGSADRLACAPVLGLESRPHKGIAGRRRTSEDPRPIAGEEGLPMALYLYQAAYTAESVAAQIKEPQDRIKAVTPALEAMGAKILVGGYPFGDYDVLVIFEAPDDTTAASVALAVAAGGATRSAKTTRLLSGQEWIDSLRKAQGSQYQPAQ